MLEVSTCTLQLPTPPSPKQQAAADQQQQQQFGGSFVGDHAAGCFPTSATDDGCFMVDDADSLLLDYIDFSTCDVVPFFDADGDVLPDLEADPTELLAEFPSSPEPEADYYDNPAACRASPPAPAVEDPPDVHKLQDDLLLQQPPPPMMTIVLEDKKAADEEKPWLLEATNNKEEEEEKDPPEAVTTSATAAAADQAEEDYSTTTGNGAADTSKSSSAASAEGNHHSHSKKKPAAAAGNNSSHAGKRKVKVDWTPELHRRFVQAVEQLGIDKAVPSRILEIMGIQCLTRHNIASHLQKYRSHRKHLMAREAEAASWAQKRQMYAGAAGTAAPARKLAVDVSSAPAVPRPWVVPTIGFPPPPAAAPFCRPLHVWGHPPHTGGAAAVEAAAGAPPTTTTMLLPLPVWPRHLLAPPPRPTVDPAAYWHQHYSAARKWGPPQPAAAVTQGTPVPVPVPVPVPTPMPRFPVPHPIPMYTPPPPPPPPQQQQQQQQQSSSKLAELQLQLDAHPSKESIDAAIGDVLVKPWLPLPLGLKPPSVDSVMSELHKQGIPKVPPAATD